MRRLPSSLAAVALLVSFAAQHAIAGLVLDLNTSGSATVCGDGCGSTAGGTLGWSFTVLNPITIDALGVWDAGADRLGTGSTPVGLWTSSGTLAATATITSASIPVSSGSADGDWLFEASRRGP